MIDPDKLITEVVNHVVSSPFGINRKTREYLRSKVREIQRDAYNQAISDVDVLIDQHEEEVYIGVIDDILKLKKQV